MSNVKQYAAKYALVISLLLTVVGGVYATRNNDAAPTHDNSVQRICMGQTGSCP